MQRYEQQFLGTTPILPVNSVTDTVRFYQNKLGFYLDVLWDKPAYAVMKRGNVCIEFGEGRTTHVGSGVCLIHVNDVDVVYQECKLFGLEFLSSIADRDYGSRDFRIKDNNGNILIISSPLANKTDLLAAGNTAR